MLSSDRRNRSKPAARGGPILASHTAASRLKQPRRSRDRFAPAPAVWSTAPTLLLLCLRPARSWLTAIRCRIAVAKHHSSDAMRARLLAFRPPTTEHVRRLLLRQANPTGSGSAWACLPASPKSARDPITKKVARRRCSARLSSTAGVQTGSGPSSNVNAHRRAPIVVLLTAERRHPTRASHSSSERAFGSGARAHRPGVQRVGRSLGRASLRADPRAPGVRSLDAARDLYDHGRMRPYLGCLRERPQGLSWVCSQLGDGGSASDHHRRV